MAEKSKWFKPVDTPAISLPWISPSNVTDDDLLKLFEAMTRGKATPRTYGLLKERALMDAPVRLAVNLKAMLSILLKGPITDVLADGLLDDERVVLQELYEDKYPPELISVAYGLLNIHERHEMLVPLMGIFARVRNKRESDQPFLDQLFSNGK